jgi:hypothetical protein
MIRYPQGIRTVRIARSINGLSAWALAVAIMLGATLQAAEAGKACKRLGMSNSCIKSSDLKARINLEEDGKNGELLIRNAHGENGVQLDASSANVTNLFSNQGDESNGLVKAWAQINADGTIAACWRCNTDTDETRRIINGNYEVDFTPLATNITGRPRSASIDSHVVTNAEAALIDVADRSGDASSLFVNTADADGTDADRPFVLLIY